MWTCLYESAAFYETSYVECKSAYPLSVRCFLTSLYALLILFHLIISLDASIAGLSENPFIFRSVLSQPDSDSTISASVRAYGVQEAFQSKSFDLIDNSTRVARTFHSLTRWATLRVDVAGATFAASLALYLVYFQVSRM